MRIGHYGFSEVSPGGKALEERKEDPSSECDEKAVCNHEFGSGGPHSGVVEEKDVEITKCKASATVEVKEHFAARAGVDDVRRRIGSTVAVV